MEAVTGKINLARLGLDALLQRRPGLAITKLDWQPERTANVYAPVKGEHEITLDAAGPWVVVNFENGEKFGIWKATGAVYEIDEHGAAGEEPVVGPTTSVLRPVAMTEEEIGVLLHRLAEAVLAGDSWEGSIEYLLPEPGAVSDPEVRMVRGSFREGNTQGTGSVTLVGDLGGG